jgi:hypothetical protein
VFDKNKRDLKPERKGDNYSSSTNAMIMFTLCVLLGRIPKSPLLPTAPLSPLIEKDSVGFILRKAFKKLTQHKPNLKKQKRNKEIITYSLTFGANDPFTLCWFLELFDALSETRTKKLRILHNELLGKAESLVKKVTENPGIPVLNWMGETTFRRATEHVFPLLRTIQLLNIIKRRKNIERNLEKTYQYFLDSLHRHLSYSSIPDIGFDAAELVFSLEGTLLCKPEARNEILLNRVFQILAERQNQSPYWQPVKPFVATPAGDSLMPLSVEVGNSFLRICLSSGTNGSHNPYISKNVELFRQYTNWLGYRIVRGIARLPSKPDSEKRFVGWVSEHTPAPSTIHLWETSQVLLFLAHYVLMLQQHLAQTTLQRANLSVKVSGLTRLDFWLERAPSVGVKRDPQKQWSSIKRKYEPLLGFSPSSQYRIYQRIYENYIVPWASFSKSRPIKPDHHVSMLLYGPPGTGKTTLVQKIAEGLDFPLIEITPSDFIGGGEREVEARAKAIFKSLEEQSEVVIFFGEIDRLILDRDSNLYLRQGDVFQFMTPGMLTKIKDLHDKRRFILIVATNFAERIDKAAKRRGRIDDQYLALPPDRKRRVSTLKDLFRQCQIGSDRISDNIIEEIATQTPLFVFDELEQLVHNVIHLGEVNDGPQQIKKVGELIRKIDPTVTLTSYQSRFKNTSGIHLEDFPTVQEPYEEFCLLVKLILEVRDFLPEEKSMVEKILREPDGNLSTKQHVRQKILKQVKDEWVKDWLLNKLTKPRLCA